MGPKWLLAPGGGTSNDQEGSIRSLLPNPNFWVLSFFVLNVLPSPPNTHTRTHTPFPLLVIPDGGGRGEQPRSSGGVVVTPLCGSSGRGSRMGFPLTLENSRPPRDELEAQQPQTGWSCPRTRHLLRAPASELELPPEARCSVGTRGDRRNPGRDPASPGVICLPVSSACSDFPYQTRSLHLGLKMGSDAQRQWNGRSWICSQTG